MIPYQVTNKDTVIVKKEKNDSPKSVLIHINGKYYKAKKMNGRMKKEIKPFLFLVSVLRVTCNQ